MKRELTEAEKAHCDKIRNTRFVRFTEEQLNQTKPFVFYKYIKSKYALEFIQTQRIKVTRLSDSNDPQESMPYFTQTKHLRQWKELLKQTIYSAICMSSKCSSLPMWGHYADWQKGVCLAFEFPIRRGEKGWLFEACGFREDNAYYSSGNHLITKVNYQTERPTLLPAPNWQEAVKSLFYRVLTTKGKEWEYEDEYRLIVQERDLIQEQGVLKYEGLAPYLRGIIMGTQCDTKKEDFEKELKKQSKFHKVKVVQARPDIKNYRIETGKFKDLDELSLQNWFWTQEEIYNEAVKRGLLIREEDKLVVSDVKAP